jgi:hypothetical protein
MTTTPIPTFPLRGKEYEEEPCQRKKHAPLLLRGRARVGVVEKFSVISVFSVARFFCR